ncbi:hypothetical protein HYW17_04900 [Candidatus Uhrbacteria bacterium]|nr:hypothetical protein [Candidatus Uhrbacteria bacterium]
MAEKSEGGIPPQEHGTENLKEDAITKLARASDLLSLGMNMVRPEQGTIKDYFEVLKRAQSLFEEAIKELKKQK